MEPTGLPSLNGEPPALTKKISLSEVADRYYSFKANGDWAPKTKLDHKRAFSLACEVIGGERDIRAVDVEDVKAFRDTLAALPPNYMKSAKCKGLKAAEAIATNKNGLVLSKKTQDKYLSMLQSLLKWALDEGYIDKRPGMAVKVAGATKLDPSEQRNPYSVSQLKSIFGSPLYTGHLSESCRHEAGSLLIRDGKFWIPLIALHSGMRLGEIVQLLNSDVKQEGGTWFFDIAKGDKKTLKTASSKRRVPVHRILLDAGFLKKVQGKAPKSRVFTDVQPGSDGYHSHNFSKWWTRYSTQVGFKEPKTAFHSFRHNFKDGLVAADVPENIAKALMGHADNSVHSSYGSGLPLSTLKAAVDKISFGLSLKLKGN